MFINMKNNSTSSLNKPSSLEGNAALRNIITQYADQTFKEFDANKSGFMDSNELKSAINKVFELAEATPPSSQEVYEILQIYDKNKDRLIDLQEFRVIIFRLNGF